MDTWPIGTRDTTEFPKLSPIKVQYRDHLEKILQLNGKAWNDIGGFGTPSRFRSYRKMYERLGIICKNGDKLVSTWLGEKVEKLEQGLLRAQQAYLDQMRNEIIAILSRYQFKNPSDRDSVSFPDDFDIQPCLCFWKMMLALDNKINYQEVNRVVLRIMHMADIDAAIEKIKTARADLVTNPAASLDDILGIPVISDQPTARIAGLFSQIGWGDLLITGVQDDGFRYLNSDAIPALRKVFENPPHFYEAKSEKDWINYFIGKPLPETFESAVSTLNVDRLEVALKVFAEKRKDDGEGGWFKSGREVNGRIREYFDPLTKEALAGFGETQITELFIGKKNADGKVEFNPMWSGSNGTGWDHIKIDSADDVKEIVDALIQYKTDAGVVSKFLDKGFVRPKGFGPSVVSELLMKFHPESCIKHGQRSHKALEWLGLIDFQWKPQYTSDEFKQVCGVAAKILAKMKAMKIAKKINADGSEDTSPPDYLTVNEFLYFVDTNLEKIKEEVMSKEFKNVSKKAKAGARKLSKAVENDEMLQRLMAALRTKPFAILAGHSGTGKSQLVRRLAYMTCNDEELLKEKDNSNAPGNYCMVQVKPNWHDSTDLLGYYTEMNGGKYHTTPFVEFICKAYAYPETPFFVCLDEMNLAPVEQYFAEFLSAIESYSETTKLTDRLITEKASPEEICGETKLTESLEEVKKHGLTIPRNLFVVGTVNVDETTCQFSRKVLDRAMTILMTAVSFKSMTEPNDPSKEECLDPDGIKFFLVRPTQATLVQGQMDKLDAIQKQVGDSPFAIAYRFANEYALYQSAYQILKGQGLKPDGKTPDPENEDSQKTAIDHVVLMKLLPRIHGARPEMEVWFNGKNGDANKIGLVKTLGDGQSVDMMKSILARVGEYLSFWP